MHRVQRKREVSILDAMEDPNLFASHFRDHATWEPWKAFLAALFNLPMSEQQLELFRQCTGRTTPPRNCNESWLCVGRRGGKSYVLSLIAVYLACFKDWQHYLGPGEKATCMLIAAEGKQSRVLMRYIDGLLTSVPMLARMIENKTKDRIDLSNRVTIETHVASFKSTRGYSLVAALCDEIAFWRTDEYAAEPDREILAAIRPGMSNIPGAAVRLQPLR